MNDFEKLAYAMYFEVLESSEYKPSSSLLE